MNSFRNLKTIEVLYFILPLLILVILGCGTGFFLADALKSGSSGAGNKPNYPTKHINGLVFSQGSIKSIAPLGGAKVTARWSTNRSFSSGMNLKALSIKSVETTTNSDGSYQLDNIDGNTMVDVTIEKNEHLLQHQIVNTSATNPQAKGILPRKNPNKKTIFANSDNDISTISDISEKGELIQSCHIIIPYGAVTEDIEVELTPYFSMENLPAPVPGGYFGLAGADFAYAAPITFTAGKEAKVYIILLKGIRGEELPQADIKLMELLEINGEQQWVIVKDSSNQDARCKYYSSGPYEGFLGPDDTVADDNQAKINGIHPFCYVVYAPNTVTIKGTIRNKYGIVAPNVIVFSNGISTTTDSLGAYTLEGIMALSSTSESLVVLNAVAAGFQFASGFVAVKAGLTVANVNLLLESLTDVAIIGGRVEDISNNNPILDAKVTCSTAPYSTVFVYDDKGTVADLTDDVLSVTPPANVSFYQWYITPPDGNRMLSTIQSNNFVVLNNLFTEFSFNSLGAYRVELEIHLVSGNVIVVAGGFLLRLVSLQPRITDITLPITFDQSLILEAFTNDLGNYRMIGVPCDVNLELQSSKSGYQPSTIRTIPVLTKGQTKEENFTLISGTPTANSIWITPSPVINLQGTQSVKVSVTIWDAANNVINPLPAFNWIVSNENVLTITGNGSIIALDNGSCTIQASSNGIYSNIVVINTSNIITPLPYQVTSGSPANNAANMPSNLTLSWGAAIAATSYDVYFGPTSPPAFVINKTNTSYNPGPLSYDATYFWRIDSKNSVGSIAGNIWSFATAIDQPPILASPGNKNINEGQLLSFTLSATDANGDSINYAMVSNPNMAGAILNPVTGLFDWTPNYVQSGIYAVTFTATAGSLSNFRSISITVANTDLAPLLTSPNNRSVNEASLLTFTLSAVDPDGDSIVFSMEFGVGPAGGGTNPPLPTLNSSTGLFEWTPGYLQAGIYTVTFTADSGVPVLTDSKTITVTVKNVIKDGLIAHWKFDETSGATAYDSSTTDNHGAVYSATRTAGLQGQSLSFDGTGEVIIPNDTSLNPNQIAIEAWVYPTSSSDWSYVISKGHYLPGTNSPERQFGIRLDAPSGAAPAGRSWVGWASNGTVCVSVRSVFPVNFNQWYYIVLTYDTKELSLFINGIKEATDSFSLRGIIPPRQEDLRIGSSDEGPLYNFRGKIDEVKIRNLIPGNAEIRANYKKQFWAETYGGGSSDYGYTIRQTVDGGYIMAANTSSFGAGGSDIWIVKLNPEGSIDWQKVYGGIGQDKAASIEQTSDLGFIIAGETNSFGAGFRDIWLLKLNPDGTIDWQKTYGGINHEWANAIKQTSDGGYIVGATTSSGGAGKYDAMLLKLNSDGTIAWQKTYGGIDDEQISSIQQAADQGFIVLATTSSFGASQKDIWLLKINSDGSVDWQNTYGGAGNDEGTAIQQTADGGYVVSGQTIPPGRDDGDIWILKLNNDGAVTWQKTFGGTYDEWSGSIRQTADGGFIAVGSSASFAIPLGGGTDLWVFKLNPDGSVDWQKAYGDVNYEWGYSIRQTTDAGYIVLSYTSSFGAGGYDCWVLKLNSDGTCSPLGTDTNVIPTDTGITPSGTTILDNDSSLAVNNTSVADTNTLATVKQQAPLNAGLNPPSNLTGNCLQTEANLTWTDNSINEDNFYVERRTGASGTYTRIGLLDSNTTTYADFGLSGSTDYFYRVRAYNAGGFSNYSNELKLTTPVINPPPVVTSPVPADGAANVPVTQQLFWGTAGGALSYDVYFGTGSPPELALNTIDTGINFDFTYNITYYWRIDSVNMAGTTAGEIWSFTTAEEPVALPVQAVDPNPAQSAANVKINTLMTWSAAAGATSYDLYFSPANPPAFQMNVVKNIYYPGTLSYNTVFYWRVDSKNSYGMTTGQLWTFTTASADKPPVLAMPGNQTVYENSLLAFNLSATDPENDPITYSVTGLPPGAVLSSTTGAFSWTPDYTQAAIYALTFTATSNLLSDSKTINITVINVDLPPVLTFPGNKTINEGQVLSFTLSATDPDDDTILFSLIATPTGMSLETMTGEYLWTTGYTQAGIYQITFIASSNLLSDSKTITIVVNDASIGLIMADAKLIEKVRLNCTVNLNTIIANYGAAKGAILTDEWAVWTEPLNSYKNNDIRKASAPGAWGIWWQDLPSSVTLKYAINAAGDFYIGALGANDSEILAVLALKCNEAGFDIRSYTDFNGNNVQNTEHISMWTNNDIRMTMFSWLLADWYRQFYLGGIVFNGPANYLQLLRKEFSLNNKFTRPVYVVSHFIYHQQKEAGYQQWLAPIDDARMAKWSPADILDADLTLAKSFEITYAGTAGSFVFTDAENDTDNSSGWFLDNTGIIQTDWGSTTLWALDNYPTQIRAEVSSTQSLASPCFGMAVLADDITVFNFQETKNGADSSEISLDRNHGPFVLKLAQGWNYIIGPVIYSSDRNGNYNIFAMNQDSTNQVQLTDDPGMEYYPLWSPDGTKIAYNKANDTYYDCYDIWLMNAEGTNQRLIRTGTGNRDGGLICWLPDNSGICYGRSSGYGDCKAYRINKDGSNDSLFLDPAVIPGRNELYGVSFSPDGKRIIWSALNNSGLASLELFKADINPASWLVASDSIQLTSDGMRDNIYGNAWNSDGNKIVYYHVKGGNGYDDSLCEIYTMNADGTGITQLTNNSFKDIDPQWTPDGRIIFTSNRSGNNDIFIMNADGSNVTQLTSSVYSEIAGDWRNPRYQNIPSPVAYLVGSGTNLSDYEIGFKAVLDSLGVSYTIIDTGQVKNELVSLKSFAVVLVNSFGDYDTIAGQFNDAGLGAKILESTNTGVNWLCSDTGGGAFVLKHLGCVGIVNSIASYSPISNDSYFTAQKLVDSPVLEGIATFPDYQLYSVNYLESCDDAALNWRVQSGTYTALPEISILLGNPTYLIKQGLVTSLGAEPPEDGLPEWINNNSHILAYKGWTRNNSNLEGGYFGLAGQNILKNTIFNYKTAKTVAHLKLDETSGITAQDNTGNFNNGVISGASRITGLQGNSLSFNGASDFINIGNNTSLQITDDITVAVWIKSSTVGANNIVISKYDSAQDAGWEIVYFNTVSFAGRDGSGVYISSKPSQAINDNQWHFVVGQRVGSVWKIYVDGVLANSFDAGTSGNINNAVNLNIGRETASDSLYYSGQIDEVKIFNYALMDYEISAQYYAYYADKVVSPTPVDGAVNIPVSPQLSWAPADRALSYDVYFDTTTAGWTPLTNTVLTFFSPSVLLYNTQYYWRIDSKNNAGATTDDVWSFRTKLAPPGNAIASAGIALVTLSWDNVISATSYNLYWSTAPGVTKLTGIPLSGITSPYEHIGLAIGPTYYYVITAVNPDGESDDSARVSALPLGDNYELDNSLETAPIIGVDTDQEHSINPIGDIDWCKFELDQSYSITLSTNSNGSPMSISLLDSFGELYSTPPGGAPNPGFSYTNLPAGTYYIRIISGILIGSYTVRWTITGNTGPGTDAYEPNNSSISATVLTANNPSYNHSINPLNETDWYKFTLAQPANVNIIVSSNGSGIVMQLYAPDASTILDTKSGADPNISYPNLPVGTYYIKVYGLGYLVGTYSINCTKP